MNRNDWILIIGMIVFCLFGMIWLEKGETNSSKKAEVYYQNKLLLTLDLNDSKETIVEGKNGDVKLISGNGKIRVAQENSKNHLCSKQGYISKSYESIVCLPNEIVIQIVDIEEYDAVVK